MDSINLFYIYVYLDPRKPGDFVFENFTFPFEPIYIGKGKGNRDMYHWKYFCDNEILQRKLIKIKNEDLEPIIMRICANLTETDAHIQEKKLIKLIGRLNLLEGTLCNLTDGGEGCAGIIQTTEHKKKNSLKNRGSYEERYGVEVARRLKKIRSQQLQGNSYGKNITKDGRQRISKANKKPWIEKYGVEYIKNRNTCYLISSPLGQEFVVFSNANLIEFALDAGLPKTSLLMLTWKSTKKDEYKGWCCKIIGTELEFDNTLNQHYNNAIIWRK